MEENKQKVIAYIDGFNFYYGLRQYPWKKYYWLDTVKLIESFLHPNQELIAVKYFSARPTDVDKRKRQDAFLHNCDAAIIISADSDMIPAIELAKEAKVRVYIYFPPNQFSSNLATMGSGMPLHMRRYEKKFKNSLLPDKMV